MKINAFVLEEDNEVVEESFIAESGHENSEVLGHKSDIPSLAALSLDAPEIASVSSSKESPEFFCASEAIRLQSGEEGLDMRPYLFDANSKAHILLDSGSQVCAWPPEPGDKVDPAIKLKAVNGSRLKCYGYKEVKVRINRKEYGVTAIKTDVQDPILGWNFTRKHRLWPEAMTGWSPISLRW